MDEALTRAVAYCYANSPHYRTELDALGVQPSDIRTEGDLARLPILLDKAIERKLMEQSMGEEGHPYGTHLCAPLADVVGVAATSGTTGDPTFYPFTAADIALMNELWATAFRFGGVRPGDTVLQAFGLSMFLAGIGIVRALEAMGARPIPVGAEAGSEKLINFARLTRPHAICCTPSYGEYLIEKFDMADLGIRHVFCAGEPGAGLPEVRARLEEGFGGATVTDMMGGGKGIMAVSCQAHAGMHAFGQEHWIQQIVDERTHEPLEWRDGAVGLRVLTTKSWRAAPWLRATIGDVIEVYDSPCECGLASPRYKVVGRADDMLIVKGVKLYPAAVRNLVQEFVPDLTGHFRIVLDAPPPKVEPPLRMRVELADGASPDVVDRFVRRMHSAFSVTPSVEPVPSGSLTRATHKQSLIEIVGGTANRAANG